jgi:threonine dehydrogenase-like Zn-dependent dehydrogenase
VLVLGLGPIGEMCTRVAQHLGAGRVLAIDLVAERLARARRRFAEDRRAAVLGRRVQDFIGGSPNR